MTNCGVYQNDDCCTSLEVPGGTYDRTYIYAPDGGGPSGQTDTATISTFRLDKYDVTVGRFRQFTRAVLPLDGGTAWTPPAGSGKHTHLNGGSGLVNSVGAADASTVYETGWNTADNANIAPTTANLQTSVYSTGPCTWTASAGSQENLPINCMTWQEAYAFCVWDGGFLPTEAEWEYAAAGGSEQRLYAWGSTAPGTSNQYAIVLCDYPSASGCTGAGTAANIAPVGTAALGAGKWGQLDLLGEMSQYVADFMAGGSPPYVTPCTDCFSQARGGLVRYVFRISGYSDGVVPSYARNADWPNRHFSQGFRCARTP